MIPLSIVDALSEGRFWRVIAETYGGVMPIVFFIGALASLVLMSIYINSESVVLTAIVAMLAGGLIIEFLPPEVRMAGYLLIIVGVTAVGSSIYLGRERKVVR